MYAVLGGGLCVCVRVGITCSFKMRPTIYCYFVHPKYLRCELRAPDLDSEYEFTIIMETRTWNICFWKLVCMFVKLIGSNESVPTNDMPKPISIYCIEIMSRAAKCQLNLHCTMSC